MRAAAVAAKTKIQPSAQSAANKGADLVNEDRAAGGNYGRAVIA